MTSGLSVLAADSSARVSESAVVVPESWPVSDSVAQDIFSATDRAKVLFSAFPVSVCKMLQILQQPARECVLQPAPDLT